MPGSVEVGIAVMNAVSLPRLAIVPRTFPFCIDSRHMSVAERSDLLRYTIQFNGDSRMSWKMEEEILYLKRIELIKVRLLILMNQLRRIG